MSSLDSAARAILDLRRPLGGWRRLRAPDVEAPFWREEDGTRQSYGVLRCDLDPAGASDLRVAHLEAINRIAGAALIASESNDRREARRLTAAASRLCGEIVGRWSPSAVEVPKRAYRADGR